MKVDGALRSLIQGVSQQPARSRLPGQCTLQENMTSNPVEGLTRRPPTEWIKDLFTSTGGTVQFHNFRHGASRFLLASYAGALRVFDLNGNEKIVNEVDNGFDYLDGEKLAFATLENDTFIANTEKICAMEDELPNFIDYGVIVHIRGGTYATTYKITVNWKDIGVGGTPRTATVSMITSASLASDIQTTNIADKLADELVACTDDGFNTIFDVTRVEDVIYIQWKVSQGRTDVFSAVVTDNAGNNNIIACNNDVKQVSQLPRLAPHGYFVKVTGDGSQSEDDYYLEFSVNPDDTGAQPALGSGFGKAGIWIETVKNDIKYLLDWQTMPHVLTYNANTDEFNFGPAHWEDRIVGDDDTNPLPSFIGKSIKYLSYFQSRLVALSGKAVIMSRTNKPLNFFAETAKEITDTDPIDIESTAKDTTDMLVAIPHNRDLVVFADGAQFIVFGRNTLTPENSSLVLTTSFEANLLADPVPAGRNIFFAINYGTYAGVREFYTEGAADINDSRPITQHVLKYISGKAKRLATTSNFDTLLVQADNLRHLYVYEYIWVGDRKAQSSWSTWLFSDDIAYFFFVESVIYLAFKQGNTYFLEKIDLNAQFDVDLDYQVKLDRKTYHTNVNTSILHPLAHNTSIQDMLFIQGEGCPYPGMRASVATYAADTVTFTDDMQGGTIIAGLKYRSAYRPTMPMIKGQDNVKIGTGRLVVSKFLINCKQSGSMFVNLLSKYRNTVSLYFSGRVTGSPESLVGSEAIVDNIFKVPFRSSADHGEIEIYTDLHTPLTILDIEWVGQYTKRGQRVPQGE